MKRVVLIVCVVIAGASYAQEEKHLQGSSANEEVSENAITELSQKRVVLEMEVAVYPNPSEGNLFVEGHEGTSVTIYSAEGTYVGTWLISEGQKVEITDLPQGTFICTITEGTNRTIRKILVI